LTRDDRSLGILMSVEAQSFEVLRTITLVVVSWIRILLSFFLNFIIP